MRAYKAIGIVMMSLAVSIVSSPLWAGLEKAQYEDKALYEDKCTGCHDAETFTRDDRKVKSFKELKNQVRLCSMNAKTGWSNKANVAVAYYLNREFYKF